MTMKFAFTRLTLVASFLVAAVSCADDHDGRPNDAGGADGDSGASVDASWLPAQCRGVQAPLLNSECMEGLSSACASHDNERDCSAQSLLNIADFEFRCGWARVVTFAQPQECSGVSSAARCVAAFQNNVHGCGDPCASLSTPNPWNTFDSTTRGELIEKPCGDGRVYLGPVQTDVCFGPQAPPLCRCAAAACMSL
jgi:hypothetical protein